jgi:1-acyl-sn-glycerol-3-phosphate acyltransferase
MWWNYRKPRPHKKGAYRMAVASNVPVIPFFITMTDSDIIGGDGFPVQEYTINIMKPIYPDPNLNRSQNIDYLKSENERICKEIYESFYGTPLTYESK